ncbi:Transient receptor potential cation channel subfamily A member 1 [Chionoecetes opilio]|uniref:Transient receptor potential cation channel subfamily A member 1 n=1 Tax=Chionoecetes opilio TaxID=41210 RepID=A0A8J5D2V5_CHIOP|nr:Transient receptor potential cation channel subfamily A member 1 [Chionoecetes opilio]
MGLVVLGYRVVRELVKHCHSLIRDENENDDTPLHLACLEGQTEVVRVLLQAGAEVEARNSSLWTPLDCASAKGHVLCVNELLDYDAPLDPIDKTKTTPLQLAAKEGHVAVTRLLLESGASLLACDSSGRNALELAVAAGKKEVCMTIVKSSEWMAAMRNVRGDSNGRRVTPFRMLIKKFPDVAKPCSTGGCTKSNGMDSDDERYAMLFNFELVDDSYVVLPGGSDMDSIASSATTDIPYDEEGHLLDHAELYTTESRELKKNHPLMMMVKYKRLNLLNHPVSISLVKHKWMSYGRDWGWVDQELSNVSNGVFSDRRLGNLARDITDKVDLSNHGFVLAGKWVIIVMAAINILREVFQIYQKRLAD